MRFGHMLAFPKQSSAHRSGCIGDTENVDPLINPETGMFAPAPLGPKPHPTLFHFVKVLRALGIPEIGRVMWEGEAPRKKALPKTPRVAKSKARSTLYLAAPIPGGPGEIAPARMHSDGRRTPGFTSHPAVPGGSPPPLRHPAQA